MKIEGSVCIVTGSATGIGAACVKALSEKGCRVVINYPRNDVEARKTQASCEALGAETLLLQGDVSRDEDCRRIAAQTLERWGRIDALVNNAAITKVSNPFDLDTLSADDFQNVFGVNVVGVYQMSRAVVPAMRAASKGAIVNVSSNVTFTGGGTSIAYTASKGAVNSMTKAFARTLGPEIRVNAVCPGVVETGWMPTVVGKEAYAGLVAKFESSAPMRRVAQPQDIADAIVWLLMGTDYVTGELLSVDGGIRLSGGSPRKG